MHRNIVYVSLQGFYAAALPDPGCALVVSQGKHVIDCNARATSLGIKLGMKTTEAKTIAPSAEFVEWSAEAFRSAQHRWLDRCYLFAEVIEPEDQHSAFLDLTGHADPQFIFQRLQANLRELYPDFLCEMAGTKWLAKAFAVSGAKRLADLPIDFLYPVSRTTQERLKFLGYRTVNDLRSVNVSSLRDLFGDEALLIQQCSLGQVNQKVKPAYPEGMIRHRQETEIDNYHDLCCVMREMSETIANHLVELDSVSQQMNLIMELKSGHERLRSRSFVKLLKSPQSIFGAMRLLVEEVPCSISALTVELCELRSGHEVQQELIKIRQRTRVKTDVAPTLFNLNETFGEKAVLLGSEVAQSRRKMVLKAWKDATGWA